MNSPMNIFFRTIMAAIGAILLIDVLGFVYNLNQSNNYETQVIKYIQTEGGVTPNVIKKADELGKKTYHGYFTLEPHGAGPETEYKGEKYKAVYPTEWSTDHDNTPIYPYFKTHTEKGYDYVTEEGSLMALLDHPNKLFAGKIDKFSKLSYIPSGIKDSDVKEVKPIGYIDKNYFFEYKKTPTSSSIPIWSYDLSNPRDLTNQNVPLEYVWDNSKRDYTNLCPVTIDPKNPKVHFNDKSLTDKQKVGLVCGGNTITGTTYKNRWSDMQANSYPHAYGGQIKYDIKINIPYVLFTNNESWFNHLAYSTVKHSSTVSLYRELKH